MHEKKHRLFNLKLKVMKTIFLSLIAMIMGILIANAQTDTINYVVTSSDTIFCGKMQVNSNKIKFYLENGVAMKINKKDIVRYSNNGIIYQRLPVYLSGEETTKSALMQLVLCQNLVKVFKEERFNGFNESLDAYFYHYVKGECVNVQKNPDLDQIAESINRFGLKKQRYSYVDKGASENE
jgi:hypothetical protein